MVILESTIFLGLAANQSPGVDACNTTLEVLLFAAAMNLGQSWYTVLTLFGALFTFYVQTWDEFFTQQLTLGIVSGPVEGILTLCIVYLLTALKGGAHFWHQGMLETFGFPRLAIIPQYLYDLPFYEWYMVYGGVVLVFNTLLRCIFTFDSSLIFADMALASKMSSKHDERRKNPFESLSLA